MVAAANLRGEAKRLVQAFYVALQALKLYPLDNETVQQALAELHRLTGRALVHEGSLELRAVGGFFYLNDIRLRMEASSVDTVAAVAAALRRHGIGCVTIEQGMAASEWPPFLFLLLKAPADEAFAGFERQLLEETVRHIEVAPERTFLPSGVEEGEDERIARARRTYIEVTQVVRELFADLMRGGPVSARKVKRGVQNIVDRVLDDEASILAMTTLRDFDVYNVTHAVNSCVFSVVIGGKLGLGKQDLYRLGLAGLLHDAGMLEVDQDSLGGEGGLTADEWKQIERHPRTGLRYLFQIRGFAEMPYRAMLATYEHHIRLDGSGYPKMRRSRSPTLFSRVVAVADAFDAALAKRSYQYVAKPPDSILLEMKDDPRWGMDPLVAKVFLGALGVYPVGTLLLLDTQELAVVMARSPEPAAVRRPIVKVITDEAGTPLDEPFPWDLRQRDETTDEPARSVVRALEAGKYGVNVGAYFL